MARPGKSGYGSACRDAMRKILQENLAPYVIQFDADLSHPPELLPRMIDALQDVAGCHRFPLRRRWRQPELGLAEESASAMERISTRVA